MDSSYLDTGESSEELAEEQERRVDALYQESLLHFQNGRWQQAAAGFEDVLRLRPEHTSARAFLEETRLKASLEQSKPQPKRRSLLAGPLRYVVMLLLLGALIVAVVTGARSAHERWIAPQKMAQEEQKRKAQQLEQALKYLADRDYAQAEEAFRAILDQDPNNEQAQQGLTEARSRLALAEAYRRAEAAIARQEWAEAADLLKAVIAQDPRYADAQAKLRFVQEQQEWSTAFARAEKAYQDGNWLEAVAAYEALHNLNAEYQKEIVSVHLFDSYVRLGMKMVEASKGTGNAVREALEWYAKALVLQPQDAKVLHEVALASKYLEGQKALSQGDLRAAMAALQWVYQQQADYAGGNVAALLQASGGEVSVTPTPVSTVPTPAVPVTPESEFQRQYALSMRSGDAALSARDYAQAETCYRQAAAAAIHGGQNAARWLFAAYVKLGTACANMGREEQAVQAIRTAIAVMTQSAAAIPPESYGAYVEQGDVYAGNGDYRNALTQYEQAVLVIGHKCNCGLEDWRVFP